MKETKEASFNVRCSKELKERLQAIANERQCSITDVVIKSITTSIAIYECEKELMNDNLNFNDYDD